MLREEDLRIAVRGAHSPCGMHVSDGAYVEITHIPTGISVAVKTGRSQMLDRNAAMAALELVIAMDRLSG